MTHTMIKGLREPGLYGDGGTLYLQVAPRGSRSWIQRVMINGKRRDIGLGGWPVVSLAKARARAFANRQAIADGREPAAMAQRQDGEQLVAATRAARLLHHRRSAGEPDRPRARAPPPDSTMD